LSLFNFFDREGSCGLQDGINGFLESLENADSQKPVENWELKVRILSFEFPFPLFSISIVILTLKEKVPLNVGRCYLEYFHQVQISY
jgi:hypothetical protein